MMVSFMVAGNPEYVSHANETAGPAGEEAFLLSIASLEAAALR
jgi:hypothetical protein